jgi:large subunit ribosomal protein L16
MTMLQPKRVKYRRPHNLTHEGTAHKGTNVDFGQWGLQSLEGAYVTDHQIEAARIVLARYTDRAGKVWIRIFPQMAKTKKPAEVRMGSGKGNPEGWVAVVKKDRMLFEIGGISDDLAREALHQAGFKLPVLTKIIKRTKALSQADLLKMEAQHESALDQIKAEDAIVKTTLSDTGNEVPVVGAAEVAAPSAGAATPDAATPKAEAPVEEVKKGEK